MKIDKIVSHNEVFELHSFVSELELEGVIGSNWKLLFGEESFYVETKRLLSSGKGSLGTIPDGYLIDFSVEDTPRLYLIEVELSSHDVFKHVMTQIGKFNSLGMEARVTLKEILSEAIAGMSNDAESLLAYCQRRDLHVSELLDQVLFGDVKRPLLARVLIDDVNQRLLQALKQLEFPPEVFSVRVYDSESGGRQIYTGEVELNGVKDELEVEEEQPDESFDYLQKNVCSSLKALGEDRYLYTYECDYIPQFNYARPARFEAHSLDPDADLEIIELEGFVAKEKYYTLKNTGDTVQGVELETTFFAPFQTGESFRAKVVIEVFSPGMPPHLSYTLAYPHVGNVCFNVDLRELSDVPRQAKLLEFVSEKASRPLVASSEAETRVLVDGALRWCVENGKTGHHYLLLWKEPCNCAWCAHRVFA